MLSRDSDQLWLFFYRLESSSYILLIWLFFLTAIPIIIVNDHQILPRRSISLFEVVFNSYHIDSDLLVTLRSSLLICYQNSHFSNIFYRNHCIFSDLSPHKYHHIFLLFINHINYYILLHCHLIVNSSGQ